MAHLPALPARVVNTSGAGDCLVAGTMWALVSGQEPATALAHGMVHSMPCLTYSPSRDFLRKSTKSEYGVDLTVHKRLNQSWQ